MPDIEAYQFDPKAAGELLEVLKWWKREHSVSFFSPPEYGEPRTEGDANDKWLRLTSNLDAGTPSSPTTATGYLQRWNGNGYDDNTDMGEVAVVDYLGNWGLGAAGSGEFIKVAHRTIGGNSKYEARSCGSGKHIATLGDSMGEGDSVSASVGGFDGITVTVLGTFVSYGTIISGTIVAIFYDPGSGAWIADNAPCS